MKKYLFLDLEYATSKGGNIKICEFGYVVTNEQFEVIERNNLIINPNIKNNEWDYRVLRTILKRDRDEYNKSPIFTKYYEKIKSLIESADYIFGHTFDGDAKAINDELKRYNLGALNYNFYDIKYFYQQYENTKKEVSVGNILKKLSIEGEDNLHDAEVDAFNTMLELKAMVNELNVSVDDFIKLCPTATNRTENYLVESIELAKLIRKEKQENEGNKIIKFGYNWNYFNSFVHNVKPNKKGNGLLNGKKVAISLIYRVEHFKETINLIQLIKNEGGTFITKASSSNIFVTNKILDETNPDKELEYLNESITPASVISFDEFLSLLHVTEEELSNSPIPDFESFNHKRTKIEKENSKIKDGTSLKELFKEKGIEYK